MSQLVEDWFLNMRWSLIFCISIILYGFACSANSSIASDPFDLAVKELYAANPNDAVQILEKLVKDNNRQAAALLGYLLRQGIYVEKDDLRATQLLKLAADDLIPDAEFEMWRACNNNAESNEPNQDCDSDLLASAVEAEIPHAMYVLSASILAGPAKNKYHLKIASSLAIRAWEKNFHPAHELIFLTDYYSEQLSSGGADYFYKNSENQLNYYANQGFEVSQTLLGSLYYRGFGLEKNLKKAFKLFMLASYTSKSRSSDSEVQEYVEKMKKEFTFDDSDAIEWLKSNAKRDDSFYSKAAKWCVVNKGSSIECLKRAMNDHQNCLMPYFGGKFTEFRSSAGYSFCRSIKMFDVKH